MNIIKKKGKAYASKKKKEERPESDYYGTPVPLTLELHYLNIFDLDLLTYEPASGEGAIYKTLLDLNYNTIEDDIRTTGKDFLQCKNHFPQIITNPPFSLFDPFVESAKRCSDKFAFIAKTNFFGAHKRWKKGIWDNLKDVYIFNRQVDYRGDPFAPYLKFGNLITGWFIWDSRWDKSYWHTHIIDIQKYAPPSIKKPQS